MILISFFIWICSFVIYSLWNTNTGSLESFGVMIDAGSSGSRMIVYKWKNHVKHSLPFVVSVDEWKQEPGISSFSHNASGIPLYLKGLLDYASNTVPKELHSQTFLYLYATAGMRLLSSQIQSNILHTSCQFALQNYSFKIKDCTRQFKVISGESEGIYGWLTLNYLKNTLHMSNGSNTLGFMDMGGASTQIAFQASKEMSIQHKNDLKSIHLRLLDGTSMYLDIFVATWLGFGANEARKRYLDGLETVSIQGNTSSPSSIKQLYDDCLPVGLQLEQQTSTDILMIKGMGSFDSCLKSQVKLLNKHLPCPDTPCYFNGMHIPLQSFTSQKFFGTSEFFYSLHDVFQLSGEYSYSKLYNSTRDYCSSPWESIKTKFNNGSFPFTRDISRLQMQCFKASWILTVLHEGFGLTHADQTQNWTFETVINVQNTSLSWTLGALLENMSEANSFNGNYAMTVFFFGSVAVLLVLGVYSVLIIRKRYIRTRKYSHPLNDDSHSFTTV